MIWGLLVANFAMSAAFAAAWIAERRAGARLLAALLLRDGERAAADAVLPRKPTAKEVPGLQIRPVGLSQR